MIESLSGAEFKKQLREGRLPGDRVATGFHETRITVKRPKKHKIQVPLLFCVLCALLRLFRFLPPSANIRVHLRLVCLRVNFASIRG